MRGPVGSRGSGEAAIRHAVCRSLEEKVDRFKALDIRTRPSSGVQMRVDGEAL